MPGSGHRRTADREPHTDTIDTRWRAPWRRAGGAWVRDRGPVLIVVLGAGEIGSYVASRLTSEGHDVVVVDHDRHELQHVDRSLDVMTVLGHAGSPAVLAEAQVQRADVLAALTDHDEVNLVACLLARQAGVARTLARLQSSELRGPAGEAVRDAMGVDTVLDPEAETADEVFHLLRFRGASDVAELAEGRLLLLGARLVAGSPLVGRPVTEIVGPGAPSDLVLGTYTRSGHTSIVHGSTVLEENDLVRAVCREESRQELMELLGVVAKRPRRVMLLGGGRVAELLAARLTGAGTEVTIVDRDIDRCRHLSEVLPGVLVLHGDVTHVDVLVEEEVGSYDSVVALTSEDDANILSCLFARTEGAEETIGLVHRLSLLGLMDEVGVDAVLSPRTASANAVLRHIRSGVRNVVTFLEGEAEVIELEVAPGSDVADRRLENVRLPRSMLVAAMIRGDTVEMAHGPTALSPGDRVIAFTLPRAVSEIRRAFG